ETVGPTKARQRPHLNSSRPSGFRCGRRRSRFGSYGRALRRILLLNENSSDDHWSPCSRGTWGAFCSRTSATRQRRDWVRRDKRKSHGLLPAERGQRRPAKSIDAENDGSARSGRVAHGNAGWVHHRGEAAWLRRERTTRRKEGFENVETDALHAQPWGAS